MPWLAAAAAAGSWALSGQSPAWLALLAFLACLGAGRWVRPNSRWFAWALLLSFGLSSTRAGLAVIPAERQASRLFGQRFLLQGTVTVQLNQGASLARVLVRQTNGIPVMMEGPAGDLLPGRKISAVVEASRPCGRRNPGGFDEAAWLAGKGVFVKAALPAGAVIRLTGEDKAFLIIAWSSRWRAAIHRLWLQSTGPDQAALLAGLLLGDASHLPDSVEASFRSAGLAHLMAASGANISALLAPLALLLRRGRVRRNGRLLALLAVSMGYGFLTGWPVSVSRAVLMTVILLASAWARRLDDPMNALALSAWLILAVKPLAVRDIGFWLSIAATGSILLLAEPCASFLQRAAPAIPPAVRASMAASCCAQAALLPLTFLVSRQWAVLGLVTNLAAIPLASGAMLTGTALLPVMLLSRVILPDGLSAAAEIFLARPLRVLLQLLIELARIAGRCPSGRIYARQLNLAFWIFWLLVFLTGIRHLPGLPAWPLVRRVTAWLMRLKGPALLAFLLAGSLIWLLQPPFEVWFLDVGQGDAVLIAGRDGRTVLVDGGKPGSGHHVLEPALDALGIHCVDLAVATHAHTDHCGGLLELAASGRFAHLAVPQGFAAAASPVDAGEAEMGHELLTLAQNMDIRVSELAENDTIALGKNLVLRVLAPQAQFRTQAGRQDAGTGNERSLILLADLAGWRLLLTADCTEETEKALLAADDWPRADFLKVAHHGSRFATGAAFLDRVKPEAAVVSVGKNIYGQPSPEIFARLTACRCKVLRTDLAGAVELELFGRRSDKPAWRIRSMLPGDSLDAIQNEEATWQGNPAPSPVSTN